jgi:hypothetical protein
VNSLYPIIRMCFNVNPLLSYIVNENTFGQAANLLAIEKSSEKSIAKKLTDC